MVFVPIQKQRALLRLGSDLGQEGLAVLQFSPKVLRSGQANQDLPYQPLQTYVFIELDLWPADLCQDISNCWLWQIDVPSFLSITMACVSPIDSALVFILVYPLHCSIRDRWSVLSRMVTVTVSVRLSLFCLLNSFKYFIEKLEVRGFFFLLFSRFIHSSWVWWPIITTKNH